VVLVGSLESNMMPTDQHRIEQLGRWLLPRWHTILIASGFVLFVMACVSDQLPEASLYVGPAIMLAGIIVMIREGL
jgi:hypothetical protein